MSAFTDVLANIIRTVDGKHDLGAGELAERIEVELAKAGITITQLPEPDEDGNAGEVGWNAGVDSVWRDRDGLSAVVSSASEAQLVYPSDPLALAAALLAAAASIPTKETPNA